MKKVCDVIFGHFVIIGCALLIIGVAMWLFRPDLPFLEVDTAGSILIMCAIFYAQIGGDEDVFVDGDH